MLINNCMKNVCCYHVKNMKNNQQRCLVSAWIAGQLVRVKYNAL